MKWLWPKMILHSSGTSNLTTFILMSMKKLHFCSNVFYDEHPLSNYINSNDH